jgi:hypothetical protein
MKLLVLSFIRSAARRARSAGDSMFDPAAASAWPASCCWCEAMFICCFFLALWLSKAVRCMVVWVIKAEGFNAERAMLPSQTQIVMISSRNVGGTAEYHLWGKACMEPTQFSLIASKACDLRTWRRSSER